MDHFDRIMDYQFTADIESEFDAILTDGMDWKEMIRRFYSEFHPKIESADTSTERINDQRYLGDDPKTGQPVYAKIGRFGPFLQLGGNDDDNKRSTSLTKDLKYMTVTFEEAMDCLAYPIHLGDHNNEPVTINIGRYGVYIKHGAKNYSMADQSVTHIEDAIALIDAAEKEKANRQIQSFDHDGDTIFILKGRYGPYISHKKVNYPIPKDQDPEALDVNGCLDIIQNAPKKSGSRKPRADKKSGSRQPKRSKT